MSTPNCLWHPTWMLVTLANKKGIKTMFGSQGQAAPVVKVLQRIIADGKIGKVLSTSLSGCTGIAGGAAIPTGYKYIIQRKAGGNHATIFFLHSKLQLIFDFVGCN
jgi:hypothetical protein